MRNLFFICAFSISVFFVVAHPSVSIIMDKKSNVYYSDLKQVWKIDVQGEKKIVVSGVHTHELFLDEQENLYGEHLWYNGDTWSFYVWKLSSSGKLDKIIPSTVGLPNGYSFVRDKNGNMYWPDRNGKCQKLIRKNKDGSLTKLGDECLENIKWMTCASDGVVYLIDSEKIKKVDLLGHISLVADLTNKTLQSITDQEHYLSGINLDKESNIYVADYSIRQLKKITPSKKVSIIAETKVPWSPIGSLSAANGDFWILENSANNEVRVERITVDGRRIIY